MALASFRKVFAKQGSGRFVVSEGDAPASYLLPHAALPTLYTDLEDNRFEIVITKGTILSVVKGADDNSYIVPASYAGKTHNDATGATPATVTVGAKSVPIGCAQYDLYRPFDTGTSQGAGWITEGYVEWPMIKDLNDDLAPGDMVRSDDVGRPVKMTLATDEHYLQVGKVIEIEKFATNFDDGMLSYMLLPVDRENYHGAIAEVFKLTQTGDYKGKLGIRGNLDVTNVVGAFRVVLTL